MDITVELYTCFQGYKFRGLAKFYFNKIVSSGARQSYSFKKNTFEVL